MTQAACKHYERSSDSHLAKPLLWHRYLKGQFIKVSRLCPPVSKLILIIRSIEDTLGVKHADNGKIAFTGIVEVLADILRRDCGNYGMPELTAYLGGAIKLPVVVQFDGTGFGNLSINTAVIRNPYLGSNMGFLE